MMKKLLVFMLVLGLVSAANASITFTAPGLPICPGPGGGHIPGGQWDVAPGQIVLVQIFSPDQIVQSGYLVNITESKNSAAGYATAMGVGQLNAAFNLNVQNGTLRNAMTNSPTSAVQRYMLIDRISGGISPANPLPVGTILYQFELKIPEAAVFCDTFTITAATGNPIIAPPPAQYGHQINGAALNPNVTNALILHVVPEPATIAILGLGALLLRRRK